MMNSMAVSHADENGAVGRQRSMRNRQCSVYASRIQPVTTRAALDRHSAAGKMPQMPQLPPVPTSPRWDSLSNGSHLIQHSPTSPRHPPYEPWPVLPLQPSPVSPAFGRGQVAGDAWTGTCDSPATSPTAASPLGRSRSPDGIAVENFSRPRKQSIRQQVVPAPDPAVPRLAGLAMPAASTPPQTPPWPHPQRLSASPSCALSQSPGPAVGDLADIRLPRVRNAAGPLLAAARSPFASSRADSAPPVPLAGGATPPWMAGDELRSSFRSQLTQSTAQGTAVTERSSVLTKDSSVDSLFAAADEPSLEDVMGMYEKGFADDDDDDDDNDDDENGALDAADADDSDAPLGSRPMRPPGDQRAHGDLAPPLPTARSALDAEIRLSKMIFTSPAFTSSVPAISGNADLDLDTAEKRDSGKSLNTEPPPASGLTATNEAKIAVASPASRTSPSPSPGRRVAMEPEDPGSRDRYGFKKQSQFVTREQYDGWNKGYSQYLARRRNKWVAYFKDCALMTDQPLRFPPANAKTKRFVRKGIPPDWRGAAWFYYAGGPAILAKHSGLYEKLLHTEAKQVDVEAIERDLHRTFPDNIQFQPSASATAAWSSDRGSPPSGTASTSGESTPPRPPGLEGEPPIITSLRRVLQAFSVYNPRIGYCQSLNFLAGLLLLFVETEEQCFWLLNVITIIYLPGTHEMSLEGSKVDLGVLMTELRDTMPAVWEKIGGELESNAGFPPAKSKSVRKPRPMLRRRELERLSTERLPPITLCMTAWFMSCYIGTLPIETTLRVWDVFFYEGSRTLFRIALAIFKTGEAEIKAVSDPMEMFGVVQSLPRRMLDANALLETCFKRRNGFGHLSQSAIDERRQERRDNAHQERARQLERDKAAAGSSMTEVEAEPAHRKGTLFGKKRRDLSRPREVVQQLQP